MGPASGSKARYTHDRAARRVPICVHMYCFAGAPLAPPPSDATKPKIPSGPDLRVPGPSAPSLGPSLGATPQLANGPPPSPAKAADKVSKKVTVCTQSHTRYSDSSSYSGNSPCLPSNMTNCRGERSSPPLSIMLSHACQSAQSFSTGYGLDLCLLKITVLTCKRDSTQYLQEDLISLNYINCVNLSMLGGTPLALCTHYMASLEVHCQRLPIYLATGPLQSSHRAYKT